MKQRTAIGKQNFEDVISGNFLYVDKTKFIREWWENGDDVTIITRPRRFGKTLNMNMLEDFFSVKYAGRGDLFEKLAIWKYPEYRELQGTYPVISLSFAGVKSENYKGAKYQIFELFYALWSQYSFLEMDNFLNGTRKYIEECSLRGEKPDIDDELLSMVLYKLSRLLEAHYGQKVLIFLDEYDAPMQEAYVSGYWDNIVNLFRNMFNNSFKTNSSLYRAVITGITRVSKESVFSDLNNPEVVTTTSEKYETQFGFTEDEVFRVLEENNLLEYKEKVRQWYDGFTFGKVTDIYNPWSIINFVDKRKIAAYWANTSSNELVSKLIREAEADIKINMEDLITGKSIYAMVDEQIVFQQLDEDIDAIWSLLLASGYLKVEKIEFKDEIGKNEYELKLTNREVKLMFETMIEGWFAKKGRNYNDFIKALLKDNVREMNHYMNRVALATFSSFDVGNHPSEYTEPERFYHGFVLGLIVELKDRYVIKSNRESGFGRYDVVLEPLDNGRESNAIVMEFKVIDEYSEKKLEDTVSSALKQIEHMQYDTELIQKGVPKDKIRHYGFAFQGKKVLIGSVPLLFENGED